ncbi:MAG TPA: hypothetical protein VF702_05430 [Allosphingosinicella sp.]|jgi:hypothetical protein
MSTFFVPGVDAENQERVYEELAALANVATPVRKDRVYSITWRHDGVEWTATVGEQLRGSQTITKGRGRLQRMITIPRSSSDTVLAIFRGLPFVIVHDNQTRTWNLPIYAGNPSRIVPFSD